MRGIRTETAHELREMAVRVVRRKNGPNRALSLTEVSGLSYGVFASPGSSTGRGWFVFLDLRRKRSGSTGRPGRSEARILGWF